MPAPIAIIAYNRPNHLEKTIRALLANREAATSELFVFSDAPKNDDQSEAVNKVRKYLRHISGFKAIHIVERVENYGLARSVIAAVNEVLQSHDRVIVLEDDLVTSRFFLKYMNTALDLYANDHSVASIHGFFYDLKKTLPDTFFLRGADCLGWGTWKRAWQFLESDGALLLRKIKEQKLEFAFNLDNSYDYVAMLENQIAGKTSSWAIRWHASTFLRNMVTLNPGVSHIKHLGNDGSGTNFGSARFLDTNLATVPTPIKKIAIAEDMVVRQNLIDFFRNTFQNNTKTNQILRRLAAFIKKFAKVGS
ncbi:MAG: glycosyltransferase [Turneriella sp.]